MIPWYVLVLSHLAATFLGFMLCAIISVGGRGD